MARLPGCVKEAHYRQDWPRPEGTLSDSVGYTLLRQDWERGTTTPVAWDDEPAGPQVAKRKDASLTQLSRVRPQRSR
jgi:hypothetical protein